MLRGKTKRAIN